MCDALQRIYPEHFVLALQTLRFCQASWQGRHQDSARLKLADKTHVPARQAGWGQPPPGNSSGRNP